MAVSERRNFYATRGFDPAEMAEKSAKLNAYARAGDDPEAASAALLRMGDTAGAVNVQKLGGQRRVTQARDRAQTLIGQGKLKEAQTEVAGIDSEMFDAISKLDDRQREAAKDVAMRLGAVAFEVRTSTKAATPERQRAVDLARQGAIAKGYLTPEQAAEFGRDDAELHTHETEALGFIKALEQYNSDRTFSANEADRTLRRAQALRSFEESRRHNQATEATGRANSARAWAAHNARVKAGGYGTPGFGAAIADDDVEIDP